ncbi:MAG: hypothetical protein O2820_02840 [Planctomycetota bacterium]|nr:hypothetical protein [Planctomycetota bacterium]
MSRRKPNAAPVTLFPFLAVLMCTMGALIVLLVLVSAQVRDDAVAKAKEVRSQRDGPEVTEPVIEVPLLPVVSEPQPVLAEAKLEPLPPMPNLDGLRRTLAGLDERERSLKKALGDRDANLAALNEEVDTVRRETALAAAQRKQLETDLKQAVRARQAALNQLSELDSERARLLASILESKKMIEQRQREFNAGNQFVIVPFDGKSGTNRRPIIIECTDRSIRFVSEEIELTPQQLLGFTPENNPLLAGANEIVRFWATHNSVQKYPGSEPVPYVLLVVRPSGTVGFYLARKFLAGLGADQGYELIEEDFEFSAPPSDPRAREMALAAIAEMLATGRTSRPPESTFSENLTTIGAGPRGSGQEDDGPRGTGSRGTFSGMTNSGRDMQSFDSRVLRHGAGPASSGFFNSNNFQKHQSGTASERTGAGLASSGARFNPQSGERIRTGNDFSSGAEPERNGVGQRPAGPPGSITGGSPENRSSEGNANLLTGPGGAGGSDLPIGLRSAPQLGTLGTSSGQPEPPKPFDFSAGPDPLIAAPANPRGSAGTGDDPQPGGGAGSAGSVAGDAAFPRGEGDLLTAPERLPRSESDPSGASPSGSAGRPENLAASQKSSSSGSAAPTNGSPGAASDGTPESQLTMSAPSRNSPRRQPPQNVRRQWGIRNPAGTIALEKSIVIHASREKIVIDGKYKITRTDDRAPAQIVDWTLLAMDRVATEWGVPPRQFYWVPAVTLVVEPGGDLLRGPLEDALRRNGVSVETRFSDGSVFESPAGGAP